MTMTLTNTILSRHKLTASIAAGLAAIAVAIGGFAIAGSGPSSGASATSAGTNATAAGKVVPFTRGQPSPATKVGQVPASFSPGAGNVVTGAVANKAQAAALAAYPGGTV